jgi:NADH-quinone oxidoreductase subunit E
MSAPALSPQFLAKADEIVARYPASQRSAALPLLHHWQEAFDFVSPQGVQWIADRLGLQPINVLELVTFYPMFRQEPKGRIHVKVCRTLSCALGGGHELHACFADKLGIQGDPHDVLVSPDGKYSLEFVECLAACGTAPVCMVNDSFYEAVNSPDKVDAILKQNP